MRRIRWFAGLMIIAQSGSWRASGAEPVDFVHDIAPIFRNQCGKCHLAPNAKGGLGLDARSSLLTGGDGGPAIVPGNAAKSVLLVRVTSNDADLRMPPQGPRLSDEQVGLLKRWIDAGAAWDEGFRFTKATYQPPLRPRRPERPPVQEDRSHPIDRWIDAEFARENRPRPEPLDDAAFARRTSLDLVGLLPDGDALRRFLADSSPDRRTRWIRELLADEQAYAEHWLTFWNDLLRNDYGGTGFITGGRKQISKWLYQSLLANKPYDAMVRELVDPSAESAGFGDGIRWRGVVSAGQTVEIQFAQSVGHALLGVNFKCASCHDSFIDGWKLDDAYGLAAIYATAPLEIHRCDKPIGRTASPRWPFPELGDVTAAANRAERLKQLADLMTHPENGRLRRTIVNRLWARLMGRGVVHPLDAMETAPWNADLLDELANDFSDHGHDLKHSLEFIATSQAYQSRAEVLEAPGDESQPKYNGPRAKRMTAEQFVDSVWTLTGAAPARYDAPFVRGKPVDAESEAGSPSLTGRWIWSTDNAANQLPAAGESVTLRRRFTLKQAPVRAGAVFTADNACECYVNGQKAYSSDAWDRVEAVLLDGRFKAGENEVVVVARNAGSGPNPAAAFVELWAELPDGSKWSLGSDASWEWTSAKPRANNGRFDKDPGNWKPAVVVGPQDIWAGRTTAETMQQLQHVVYSPRRNVRAALLKSDFLQRSLGRPNRDQIVTARPAELSTLEAIDLNNDRTLADYLDAGAKRLLDQLGADPARLAEHLYWSMLCRKPTPEEMTVATEALGPAANRESLQDYLWALLLQPEFQLVR